MTIEEILGVKPAKNRAQRRREAREQERQKGVWMTVEELKRLSATDTQDAFDQVSDLVLYTVLMVLHREFGFGQVRAVRFLKSFEEYFEPFITQDFTAKTVEEQVEQELGLKVTIGGKRRPWRKWK